MNLAGSATLPVTHSHLLFVEERTLLVLHGDEDRRLQLVALAGDLGSEIQTRQPGELGVVPHRGHRAEGHVGDASSSTPRDQPSPESRQCGQP